MMFPQGKGHGIPAISDAPSGWGNLMHLPMCVAIQMRRRFPKKVQWLHGTYGCLRNDLFMDVEWITVEKGNK